MEASATELTNVLSEVVTQNPDLNRPMVLALAHVTAWEP